MQKRVVISRDLITAAAKECGYTVSENGNLEKLPVVISCTSLKKFKEVRASLLVILQEKVEHLENALVHCIENDPVSTQKLTDAFTQKTSELYAKFSFDVERWSEYLSVPCRPEENFKEVRTSLLVILQEKVRHLEDTLVYSTQNDPVSTRKLTDAFTQKTSELYAKFSSDVERWSECLSVPCRPEDLNPFNVDQTIPIVDQPIQNSCVN